MGDPSCHQRRSMMLLLVLFKKGYKSNFEAYERSNPLNHEPTTVPQVLSLNLIAEESNRTT